MNSCLPVWPHDLLWGLSVADVPADAPAWVTEVVGAGQPVVVRRAKVAEGGWRWVCVVIRAISVMRRP